MPRPIPLVNFVTTVFSFNSSAKEIGWSFTGGGPLTIGRTVLSGFQSSWSYNGSYQIFGAFNTRDVVRYPIPDQPPGIRTYVVQDEYAGILFNAEPVSGWSSTNPDLAVAWFSNPTYLYDVQGPGVSGVGFGEADLAALFGEVRWNSDTDHGPLVQVVEVPGYNLKQRYDTGTLVLGDIVPETFVNVSTSLGPLTMWGQGEWRADAYFVYEAGRASHFPTPAPEPASYGLAGFGFIVVVFWEALRRRDKTHLTSNCHRTYRYNCQCKLD